ncbi:acyl-CoA thioesterase [candidate division KSB1 bacterium]|nr:MAG: acyl-CoA thioesterase [candidate division KSB1 bacterium]
MSQPFRFPYTIGLHDTDAANLIFSANIIRICHMAYEAMLEEIGFGMAVLFEKRTMYLPVVHIEADFVKPSSTGQKVEIIARVERIGKTSYRMAYELRSMSGELCATAATVHVCADPKTREPMDIPPAFRAALSRFA